MAQNNITNTGTTTFLCQTNDHLPPDGVNLNNPDVAVGIGTTGIPLNTQLTNANWYPSTLFVYGNGVDTALNSGSSFQVVTDSSAYGTNASHWLGGYTGTVGVNMVNLSIWSSRGSITSPAPIRNNDVLFAVDVNGSTDTLQNGAYCSSIRTVAEGNFTPTSTPTRLSFFTTGTSGAITERAKIDHNGLLTASYGITSTTINAPTINATTRLTTPSLILSSNSTIPTVSSGGVLQASTNNYLYYTNVVASSLVVLANNPTSQAGDILVGSGGQNYDILNIGTNGQVLTSNGTTAVWSDPAAAPNWSTVTASQDVDMGGFALTNASYAFLNQSAGSVLATDGGVYGVNTSNNPYYYNSTNVYGLPLVNNGGSAPTDQDLLVGNNVGSYSLLNKGADGDVMTMVSGSLAWQAPSGGAGTVTSVELTSPNENSILSGTNPITSSGTINIDVGAPVIWDTSHTFFSVGPRNFGTGTYSGTYIINGYGLSNLTGDASSCTAYGWGSLGNFQGAPTAAITAIGAAALTSCTTGTLNTAVGSSAALLVTTGLGNTAVGSNAGSAWTTENNCTAVGLNALYISVHGISAGSVALGANAGYSTNISGSYTNNTFLGTNCRVDDSSTSATYRTGVGYDVLVGDDHLVQLGKTEAIGIGLYGSSAPASLSAAGGSSGYAALSVINPGSGSVYQLAISGRSGISGLSGLIPIMTSTDANAAGSLLVGNGTNYAPLTIGTNGYVLTSNGTTAVWAPGGGGGSFPADTYYDSSVGNFLIGTTTYVVGSSPLPGIGNLVLYNGTANILSSADTDTPPLNNILIANAGDLITTATNNIAISNVTSLSTGTNNTLIGLDGNNVATGSNNTSVGYGSLASFDGSGMINVGSSNGNGLTTGYDNVLIGNNVLALATSTDAAVAIGSSAAYNASTVSGLTALGLAAGNVATGLINNCVFVGTYADANVNNPTNISVIGANAQAHANNVVVLGDTNITGVGIGSPETINYSLTIGGAGSKSIFMPPSSTQSISIGGGVYWVNSDNQPFYKNTTDTYALVAAVGNASSNATCGTATIAAGQTSVTVPTTAMFVGLGARSVVICSYSGFTGTATAALGSPYSADYTQGASFTLNIPTVVPTASSVTIDWLIINPA